MEKEKKVRKLKQKSNCHVFFNAEIDQESIQNLCMELSEIPFSSNIILHFTSCGGVVYSANMFINFMKDFCVGRKIKIIVYDNVASCAVDILLALANLPETTEHKYIEFDLHESCTGMVHKTRILDEKGKKIARSKLNVYIFKHSEYLLGLEKDLYLSYGISQDIIDQIDKGKDVFLSHDVMKNLICKGGA